MHGKCSIDIEAPAEQVWDLCSGEYRNVYKWLIRCPRSEQVVDPESTVRTRDGSTGRKLFQPNGSVITATLLEHSDENMTFFYKSEGLPSFILEAKNRWTIEKVSDSQCRFHLELNGKMNFFPGIIMDPIMSSFVIPGALKGMCESLKHFVETGEPTEAKKKELEQANNCNKH